MFECKARQGGHLDVGFCFQFLRRITEPMNRTWKNHVVQTHVFVFPRSAQYLQGEIFSPSSASASVISGTVAWLLAGAEAGAGAVSMSSTREREKERLQRWRRQFDKESFVGVGRPRPTSCSVCHSLRRRHWRFEEQPQTMY